MKKVYIILVVLVSLFVLSGCNKEYKTIEEITGVKYKDIKKCLVSNSYNEYDVNKFVSEHKKLKYKKYDGKYNSEPQKKYICYGENNEILFTFIEIGNKDQVFIKKGEFNLSRDWQDSLYEVKK